MASPTPTPKRRSYRDRIAKSPWRALYNTARWKDLRQKVLVRDRYTCQRTGELCIGGPNERNSPVVNHIKFHKGDLSLFWDINNLETVTKEYHDSAIQGIEKGGTLSGSDETGMPLDPNHPWNRKKG